MSETSQWQPQVGRVQQGQVGVLRTVQQLVKTGKLDEAQAMLTKAVKDNPSFALGHLMLGNTFFRQRRFKDALGEYQKALQGNPNLAPAPLMMGMVYRLMQEPKNALEHYDVALDIDPDLVLAHVEKGRVQLSQNEPDDAVASIKLALASNPQSVPARLMLAEVHAHSGEEQKALDLLHDLARDRPELVIAHLMRGMLLLRLERLEEAKVSLQTVSQLAPDRPFPTYMLGNVHYRLNEFNAAEKCYRDIVGKGGKFLPAKYALADVLVASDRHTEAIAVLHDILTTSRRKNACHQRLGAIYTTQGRYERALEEFRAALKHDPEILAIDPAIESVLEESKNDEEAAKAFVERLKVIRVESISRLKAGPFRDGVRARRAQKKMGRLTGAVA